MTITFYKNSSEGETRYYTIHDRQGSLFNLYCVTALWGGSTQSGRERVYSFSTEEERDRKVKEICRNKIRAGYKVLYSFSRKPAYMEMFRKLSSKIS